MGVFRKYQYYKRILIILFFLNIFFIICGSVAGYQYLSTHEPPLLTLALIGVGTLLFGILVPIIVLNRIAFITNQLRRETEASLARLITGWLENYRATDDPMRDPHFWIRCALVVAEVFGQNLKHPVGRLAVEFAPFIKAELERDTPKKSRSRKKESAS